MWSSSIFIGLHCVNWSNIHSFFFFHLLCSIIAGSFDGEDGDAKWDGVWKSQGATMFWSATNNCGNPTFGGLCPATALGPGMQYFTAHNHYSQRPFSKLNTDGFLEPIRREQLFLVAQRDYISYFYDATILRRNRQTSGRRGRWTSLSLQSSTALL